MKILVIFTGGTIGSTVDNGYISTDDQKTYRLIEQYNEQNFLDVEFTFAEPYSLLSENLTGEHLRKLGDCILENQHKGYDGIIVTHGTDTIQYSAAAMGYYLPNISIPIQFVSSNFVLEDPAANGLANFTYAVEFIAKKRGTGVFVIYRNNDNIIYVHRGTRLLPHLPYNDDLISIQGQYYGLYQDGAYKPNSNYTLSQGTKSKDIQISLSLPQTWDSQILCIYPYPGMCYPQIKEDKKAILLETYHSGTICSITPQMEDFFHTVTEKGIPIFLTGADEGPDYESVKMWKNHKVCTLPLASPIAMYIKLWMTLQSKEQLNELSLEDILFTSIGEDLLV